MIHSGQMALEKTTASGQLIVPAGSVDSDCTPKVLSGSDETAWFIDDTDRAAIARGITAEAFTDTANGANHLRTTRATSSAAAFTLAVAQKKAESAGAAFDVLTSPTHLKLVALMSLATSASTVPLDASVRRALSAPSSDKNSPLPSDQFTIDRNEWRSYVNKVTAVSMTDGWAVLYAYTTGQLGQENVTDPQKKELTILQRESRLISAYLAAYFRQGHFIAVTVDPAKVNSELNTKVGTWIKAAGGTGTTPSSADLVTTLTDELLPSQCKASGGATVPQSCDLIGAIGDSGFVTRAGDKYAFPALNLQVDPLAQQKIQKPQVNVKDTIADLVRVVLEATGDALNKLPAAQGSTGCTSGLLKCYDPKASGSTVNADNFQKVNAYAAEAETVASGTVGLIVRGGFWVALNNENLATAVEVGVGVTARKAAERVAWDYLACRGPGVTRDFRAVATDAGGYRLLNVNVQ